MSEWHEILTKAVDREIAFLINHNDCRIKLSQPAFVMNVKSRSYNVYGKSYEEGDPFITLYRETAEKLSKNDFDDMEKSIQKRVFT